MRDLGEERPRGAEVRIAGSPVFSLKSAAISFAGSVKLAATATLVWPAPVGVAAKTVMSAAKSRQAPCL